MQLVWEGSSHHIAAIKQINTAVTKVLAISDLKFLHHLGG